MTRLFALTLITALCFATGLVFAREPVLEDALTAPPYHLAKAYLGEGIMTAMLDLARGGVTIHTPEGTITKDNVEDFAARYGARAEVYSEAIQKRGYQDLSGTYSATATSSCSKAGSFWASLIEEGLSKGVEIRQKGFEGFLGVVTVIEGEQRTIDNRIVVVESAIALVDMMNSDYFFEGRVDGETLTFHPDPTALENWPGWANPPKRKNLEKCAVTLKKIS